MYSPKYIISNSILKAIGQVEAAKEIIEEAPLVPTYEKQFISDAIIRTVYHGTHIEGNDLTLMETKKVLEGQEVYARPRDVQEVINYRNVVKLIDELRINNTPYSVDLLKRIHSLTVYRIISEDKVGTLRNTQVIIKEEGTGKIILSPPPFVEVPFLLEEFFSWLNSDSARQIHPVIRAGIVHYVLVAIHPFVEGNGRSTRALATLVMLREGYDIKRFFALEEHFDTDLAAYYEAFFKVDNQSPNIAERDVTVWLEYFTQVVAIELTRIKDKIKRLSIDSRLKMKIGTQIALTERQMRLMEFFSDQGSGTMKEFRSLLPMISDDTILRDLTDLIKKGVIKKSGSTKAARYVLADKK
ncbi:Fic family protein [Candidatus Microgenomates bacterium]|nr:Fic family protein [Candidatus Microgenomates bacterium]